MNAKLCLVGFRARCMYFSFG